MGRSWPMAQVVYEHLFDNNSEQLDHNVIPCALDDGRTTEDELHRSIVRRSFISVLEV